jgi:hypothetical protein
MTGDCHVPFRGSLGVKVNIQVVDQTAACLCGMMAGG